MSWLFLFNFHCIDKYIKQNSIEIGKSITVKLHKTSDRCMTLLKCHNLKTEKHKYYPEKSLREQIKKPRINPAWLQLV